MSSGNLVSVNGKFHTQNGAAPLNSCGVSSSEKGIFVALSVLANSPERMNIWHLHAPGDGTTEYLYFKNIIDVRTCALNEGSLRNAVRLTGTNGELYVLECKNPAQAQAFADNLSNIAKESLEANRGTAEGLQLFRRDPAAPSADTAADHVTIPDAGSSAKVTDRKGGFLRILGIVMQTIGYLVLVAMAGALFSDTGNTDWTGAGICLIAMIALIIGGNVLVKKN